MWEKLKEYSKYAFIASGLLYVFGFISTSSFLGHFGIVSFDVFSSRIIVAGLFSLISILLIILINHKYILNILPSEIFKQGSFKTRFFSYIWIFFITYFISNALVILLNAFKYTAPGKESDLIFTSSKYDIMNFGLFIDDYIKFKSPSLDYIFTLSFTLFLYALCLYLVVEITYRSNIAIAKYYGSHFVSKAEKPSVQINDDNLNTREPRWYETELLKILEILLLMFSIALATYAYHKIKVAIFDFNSFDDTELRVGLFFSWSYVFLFASYIFLGIINYKKETRIDDFAKRYINNPDILLYNLTQAIIPVIIALWIFGQVIFPRIPYSIGGGEPREVVIGTKTDSRFQDKDAKIYQIGESQKFIYIVMIKNNKSDVYQVNKDTIDFVSTITTK